MAAWHRFPAIALFYFAEAELGKATIRGSKLPLAVPTSNWEIETNQVAYSLYEKQLTAINTQPL